MAEDIRQPPYLCPVDLKKVLVAIGEGLSESGDGKRLKEREIERYKALLEFCEGEEWVDNFEMFVGYAAWIRERLKVLEGSSSN